MSIMKLLGRRSVESDLAILQAVESFLVKYAMLSPGPEEIVDVGMEVFAISHPHSLNYTYVID